MYSKIPGKKSFKKTVTLGSDEVLRKLLCWNFYFFNHQVM